MASGRCSLNYDPAAQALPERPLPIARTEVMMVAVHDKGMARTMSGADDTPSTTDCATLMLASR